MSCGCCGRGAVAVRGSGEQPPGWVLLCPGGFRGELPAETELSSVQRMLLALTIFPQIKRKLSPVIFKRCIL